MKFDCIIMNPPYQKNLHLKILAEAIKHLKDDDSKVVNLSPVRWLQDPLAKYKKNSDYHKFEESVSKHIESLDVIFPQVASEMFGIGLNSDLGLYSCSFNEKNIDLSNIKNSSNKDFNFIRTIYNKLYVNHIKTISELCIDYSSKTSMNFVLIQMIGGHVHRGTDQTVMTFTRNNYGYFENNLSNGKTLEELRASNPHVTNGKIENWPTICFNTGNEAKNFLNSSNSKFMLFLSWAFSSNQQIESKALPWMGDSINPRTGKKGYESEWTDEDFYKFFNITDDEKKVIEETMAKYVK